MERISVRGTTDYDVLVGSGLLDDTGEILRSEVGGSRALIVSDTNVAGLYLERLTRSLRAADYAAAGLVLASGEESKTLENYMHIIRVLAEKEFEKSDVIIALGGGMIGDITGFAAATYKRGIRFAQMPTTLLSAVDASVGGKNAVNLAEAKNQVGTIRNPAIVICDSALMKSLPESELLNGRGEIIKYGILNGYDIIEALRTAIASGEYEDVICRSVRIKRDIVEMDEGDDSFRQYLNLGHLAGHAIEAAEDYAIPHGSAVARGLAIEAKSCALSGLTEMSTYMEITALLEEFGFDLSDRYSTESLMPFIMRDKRIRKGSINIIVPRHIGECDMHPLTSDKLTQFIGLGL